MTDATTIAARGWRHVERYAYVERPYEEVWAWLAGHLSTFGAPLPGGGHAVELRIRPRGVEVSRPVRLHVGGLVAGEHRARASLRWADATRPHLFPQLEAELEIVPVPHDLEPFTQLGLLARYHPPLGPLGAVGDRLVGEDVTDAALTTFLDEVAEAVADHTSCPARHFAAEAQGENAADDAAIQRLLLTVDRLAARPGGAVGACQALAAVPGVVHVSLDPWTGLVAVDHDPTLCGLDEMTAALDEQAARPGA